jgi:DNA-binding MarR family transcriptional regulator
MQQQTTIGNRDLGLKVTDKELTILYEIGLDLIPTATELVESVAEKYNASQSGVWYTLKKLKAEGLVNFAEKGEAHRPLTLTELGTKAIRSRIVDVQNRQYHYVVGVVNPIGSRS